MYLILKTMIENSVDGAIYVPCKSMEIAKQIKKTRDFDVDIFIPAINSDYEGYPVVCEIKVKSNG